MTNNYADNNFQLQGQYVKDLSFENPNSPGIYVGASQNTPKVDISVDVEVSKLKHDDKEKKNMEFHEVTLKIKATAKCVEDVAFICELKYAGLFVITDITQFKNEEDMKHLLLVEAPAIIFPFARELVARASSSAGFPPLMLEIVNFEKIYREQNQQ